MRAIGIMFQIIGALAMVGGVLLGILQLVSGGFNAINGINLIVGGLIGGALVFGLGRGFETLIDIENNTRRSANALENLAHRQRSNPSSRPQERP